MAKRVRGRTIFGTGVFQREAKGFDAPVDARTDAASSVGGTSGSPPQGGSVRGRTRLLAQFLIASAVTICVSMTLLAYWVSERLETGMVRAAAEEGGLLIETFLGPEVQELAGAPALSPAAMEKLDLTLREKLGGRVKVVKIWLRDGTLVYATDKKLVGRKFPSPHLDAAFAGRVSGSFDELDDRENQFDRELRIPLIEIYAPFHRTGGGDIIAVGEIYNDATRLAVELRQVRWATAAIVVCVTAPMALVLFLMVWRSVAIVRRQEAALRNRMNEARALAAQNDRLRREAEDARLDTIESNERLLGEVGQDLHDGPIQLLGILMLKLTDTPKGPSVPAGARGAPGAADLVDGALTDLRNISRGLVLPQLEGLTANETIRLAVRRHEDMTGTTVDTEIDGLGFEPEPTLRTCLFRIVQEGLNNAYFHAEGNGQRVVAGADADHLTIAVSDSGARFDDEGPGPRRTGLGVSGLRRRVEAFRGSLDIAPHLTGTRMTATIPLSCITLNVRRDFEPGRT